MSAADCARFESDLALALAAPGGCEPRVAASLRAHAAACDACRGSLDLVDLATEPAAERDPIPEPPPSYWTKFESELALRLSRERRRRGARWPAAAAAVAAAIVLAVLVRDRTFRSETPPALPPLDEPAADRDDGLDAFPAAGVLGGFSEEDESSLFSGADDLTPEDQERLLEWLKHERERRAGGAA